MHRPLSSSDKPRNWRITSSTSTPYHLPTPPKTGKPPLANLPPLPNFHPNPTSSELPASSTKASSSVSSPPSLSWSNFFCKCWGKGQKKSGNVVLILTWERAGGRASQHAPDLHLQSAYGECATGMQTGGNLTQPSGESHDLPDRYQTATHSLLSRDTQCACLIQTVRVGLRDGTEDESTRGAYCCRQAWPLWDLANPRSGLSRCKCARERRSDQDQNGEVRSLADWALPSTIWRLGDRQDIRLGPTRWCMPHRLDAALWWEVTWTRTSGMWDTLKGTHWRWNAKLWQAVESITRWKRTTMVSAWLSSAGTNTWRWWTRTIPEEALHIGTHWEGGKSHPGWITCCFRPRDFSWSSIASSSEERADVFSSSPTDAHATIGLWW